MNSTLVLSKEWWRWLVEQLNIPSTDSVYAIYLIFVLGLLGLILIRINKRLPKILLVIFMGLLELYHFGCFEFNPDWFLSSDVTLLSRLITFPVLVMILTVQCVLTDEIFLKDSLEGDQRFSADIPIISGLLLYCAVFYLLAFFVCKWSGSFLFSILIGYIGLLLVFGVLAQIIRVNHLGNTSMLLFFVYIISLGGILITFSYCMWTGLFTLLACTFVFNKKSVRSVAYFTKLKADSGDQDSIFRMARIYQTGQGVPKDEKRAVCLYQEMADSGNAKAFHELAKCYFNGIGVIANKQMALELAEKSLNLGCVEAKLTIGNVYFELGKAYWDGQGVNKDEKKAIDLFEKAGEFGNSNAFGSLADCYLSGRGVAKNGKQAFEYAMKSYKMGNINACAIIGSYYRTGEFIPEDHVNGHKWDMIGAQAGNVLCQIRVGIDFQKGYGTPENKMEACKWYKKVADNNEASQKYRGMASYRYGVLIGILGNIPEGKEYIRKAQRLGNQLAIEEGNKYLNS